MQCYICYYYIETLKAVFTNLRWPHEVVTETNILSLLSFDLSYPKNGIMQHMLYTIHQTSYKCGSDSEARSDDFKKTLDFCSLIILLHSTRYHLLFYSFWVVVAEVYKIVSLL